jgi:hypothetical protein
MRKYTYLWALAALLIAQPCTPQTLEGSVYSSDLEISAEWGVLDWTEWRKTTANIVFKRVKEAYLSQGGTGRGKVRVKWTVYRDHHIDVVIVRDTNESTHPQTPNERAIVIAITSLSGNPIMEFPEGSRREKVVTEEYFEFGDVDRIYYIQDDREILDGNH